MLSYIIVFVLGFIFSKYLPDLRKRSFAAFMSGFDKDVDPKFLAFKSEAFGPIKEIKSKLPEHQKTNTIKILEIGVGSGTNFTFYPEGCHLVVVDPNPHFKKYYDANRAKFPQIKSEEIIVAGAQNMDMVEDDSVDVVVICLVLCSVDCTKQILLQVRRVLVPGGKLFFMEHVKEWDSKGHGYKQMFQEILSRTRIWPGLFDGCELHRETLKDIEAAGFSEVNAKKMYAPITHPIFQLVNSQILGSATK